MQEHFVDNQKTQAIIYLDAIAHNYNYTKNKTNKTVICVIKADAYGHGAVRVAKRLEKEGADYFAVATIDEALQLRKAKIKGRILVLGYVFPQFIRIAIKNNISITVSSLQYAKELSKATYNKKANIHIKLNTGMNRTGFKIVDGNVPDDLKQALDILSHNKNVHIEGLFTHFAKAENDESFTKKQFENYMKGKDYLQSKGVFADICHVCNSAGVANYPDMYLDAVRLGINLYGQDTDDLNYLPAMSFNTSIVDIYKINKSEGIGYGLTYVAPKDMKIAVIGAGYADGLRRSLSGKDTCFLCNGKRVKLIGTVCMDMAMIDITDLDEVKIGDTVTIWGKNAGASLKCQEQAQKADTISYELLCCVSDRVPRIYIEK